MKKVNVLVATAVVAAGVSFTSCDSKKHVKLTTAADSASYAAGVMFGSNVRQNIESTPGTPLDKKILVAAFEQALDNDSANILMTPESAYMFIQQYFAKIESEEAEKAKQEGEKFLAENATQDGVVTTESGLQYKVLTEGTGAKPKADDKVKVHYKGMFLDGTEFDSSYGEDGQGQPAEINLDRVIKGWTEGLQIMPVGSKYIFWIPSDLAYGARPRPGMKPNATLKFEVELIDIVKDEEPQAGSKK